MIIKKLQKNKGFVILFAVTLSAILLSIALGVANVATKEIKFGTSAKESNDAFFAADTGAECALFYDNASDTTKNAFTGTFPKGDVKCAGVSVNGLSGSSSSWSFTFIISDANNVQKFCASVTMAKTTDSNDNVSTAVVSKGYNNDSCSSSGSNSVERELDVNY